ncbi:General secretion pathway protein GspE [Georgfuchsia toluolica]|uniref:General secretion pathway protein GspE n=1 Tax=Georgfuchsia toluolica TaxID=424218 RepID=A0A916J495_9PROT|nr:GspE/PulE family protein [Georgfuchsia toluolica]CAG4882943.1 General secretion pathway protein GspE [Georgfuchsia toluolica]
MNIDDRQAIGANGTAMLAERRRTRLDRREIRVDRRLVERAELPLLDIDELYALTPAFDILPYADAAPRQCIAMMDADGRLMLIADKSSASGLMPWADAYLRRPFALRFARGGDIAAVLSHHGETMRAMDALPDYAEQGAAIPSDVEVLRLDTIQMEESPIVRLTNSTLYDAYKVRASDIHLESTTEGLCVKYRLDGVLSTIAEPKGSQTAEQVISRIKVMAELDIAERRVPQDGRFKVAIGGREVDFRVSIMPSIHGEDAVLRILDKQALTEQMTSLTLDSLGFEGEFVRTMRRLAREPYGMLLVTGPTGSGKTTTLYAAISEINSGHSKIVTIEDPVEYQLPGVLQIPVNEKKGLTFSRGLRSILRHDPDTIMVGEIRDADTAQIAIQSALTGHLVFTTVHANNALDVISRFLHMDVAPQSFVSAINGILAQRLVRVNCPHCSVAERPNDDQLIDSGINPAAAQDFNFRKGRGCAECRGTGYKGRKAIAELLLLTEDLRELIVNAAPLRQLREEAARGGMTPLRDTALDLVRRGESTLEEINRVTFVA